MAHEVWEEYYDRLTRADCRTQDDADLREHAPDGRADGPVSERTPRRRRGDRAPREPREGDAPRRRASAEDRRAEGARGDGVARARHRHRPRRSRLPDRIAAPHRDVPAARRSLGPLDRRHAEGPADADVARRPRRMRGAAPLRPPGRARSHRRRTTRRSTCSRSRSRRRSSCAEHREDDLFGLVQRAWPYRDLARGDFDAVVAMVSEGFATRRGRRAALVHRDEVHGVLRGRRGTRMLAMTAGGAIPEVADYRVVLEPDDTFIGTRERGLRHREHGRRRVSARQRVVASRAGGGGNGARVGRAGRAAEHSVLVRRGAGPQRRAVSGRVGTARGLRAGR